MEHYVNNTTWNGTGLEGKGTLNSKKSIFNNTPYSFNSRFENADGTAPILRSY
jgi:osmotically inducible protein OsmC